MSLSISLPRLALFTLALLVSLSLHLSLARSSCRFIHEAYAEGSTSFNNVQGAVDCELVHRQF